jgi:hypothetical protein
VLVVDCEPERPWRLRHLGGVKVAKYRVILSVLYNTSPTADPTNNTEVLPPVQTASLNKDNKSYSSRHEH